MSTFIMRTAEEWYSLPADVFPENYDLDLFKARVKRHFLGKSIKVFHEKQPCFIPWNYAGVEYVVESSGVFATLEKALGHLSSDGIRLVVVTAPSVDLPMVILGVNDHTITKDEKVISTASSTLYCLAPVIKVLESNFGIADGFVTSIHAITPSLKPLDSICIRGNHWRDHRGIHQNIIPAATGACKALFKIIPQVRDKLAGIAFRVPIVDVSVLDLSIRLKTETSLEKVISCFAKASKTYMKGIISICNDQSVSSDFIHDSHSCILDAGSCLQLKPDYYKLICWYENEYSYACRVLDCIVNLHSRFDSNKPQTCKLDCPVRTCSEPIEMPGPVDAVTRPHKSVKISNKHFLFRKPVSDPSTDEFSRYQKKIKFAELCRIWNHDHVTKTAARNRAAIYQNYTKYASSNNKRYQSLEKLDKAKKELDKMTSITENLLKRSCITIEQDNEVSLKLLQASDNKTSNETHNTKESPHYEEGDYKDNYELSDNSKALTTYSKITDENEKLNNDKSKESVIAKSILRKVIPEKTFVNLNIRVSPYRIRNRKLFSRKQSDKIGKLHNFGEQVLDKKAKFNLESIQTRRDGDLTLQNSGNLSPTNCIKLLDRNCTEKGDVIDKEVKSDCGDFSSIKSNSNLSLKISASIGKFSVKLTLSDIQKEELSANGFKLPSTNIEEDVVLCGEDVRLSTSELKKCSLLNDSVTNQVDDAKMSNVVIRELPSFKQLKKTDFPSTSISPQGPSEIILDKLDSVSGSDSESSFEINKRKSQVIHISDLTASLEDLRRLDKICKIIEISDELSNDLFSTLTSSHTANIKIQKWSFKDLCEKIKLDEFCEKVFGKL